MWDGPSVGSGRLEGRPVHNLNECVVVCLPVLSCIVLVIVLVVLVVLTRSVSRQHNVSKKCIRATRWYRKCVWKFQLSLKCQSL